MDSTQDFNCIFCKESFSEKEELQIHFRKHGDPKFNQSVKNNKSRLSSDSQASGDTNEEGEKVSCDVCSDVFPTISKAITHKHKVHPDHDAKYFCPWCGKLFTMKHLYNKHIQTTHDSMEQSEETGFHCDYCEVDFFIPSAMVYHNKFFHRQDTELAVIGHSKKLKLFNQELLQLYYCPFCGEEYYNKVNLHKHMGDDHIDENQSPDDVLRCPLCDAIFYHLDAYELHLTFHSSRDTYSEENEMANDITEFSLETVPPIMEKVENDTQDEGESTNTMGIEELLQQAMNETNDGSNSEGAPRKKSKKHKKHKKSKKAAITLDEFLNMNQDVFGEDIDFQGIEVVPEQVVAKQLKGRRAPLKSKTGPKMLSKDLAKLKKQGIVVKKKSIKNVNKVSGTFNKGTPVKIAHNLVTNKPPVTQTKAITSDEVLTKLLNQGNSQIKIVKRFAQDQSVSDLQMPSEDIPVVNERNEDISDKKIEETATNTSNGEMNVGDNYDEPVDNEPAKTLDVGNIQKDRITGESETNNKLAIEKELSNNDKAEFLNCDSAKKTKDQNYGDKNSKDESKLETLKINVANPLNALRNISQHLTIKSLSSPKNVQSEEKSYLDINVHNPNCDSITNTTEQNDDNKITKESKLESLKTNAENPLNSLRNVNQHLTIKSLSSPKNVLKAVEHSVCSEEKPYSNNNVHNPPESDKDDNKHNEVIQEIKPGDVKSIQDQHENNSNMSSLNALKHLSHLITVKPVNKNATIAQNDITENKTDTQEDSQNKDDDNYEEICTEPEIPMAVIKKESPNVKEHPQVKKETPTSLDAFKNISKNITIKSVSQKNENVADKHFNDRIKKGTHEIHDEDMDLNVETLKKETEKQIESKINTKLASPTLSQKSVQNLKSPEIRNHPNSPLSKINRSAPEYEMEKPDRQINFESNETAVKKESCTNILKHLPNVTAKPVTQNTSQKVTVQSSTQSMNFLKGYKIQKSVNKEINEEIEIFNVEDSDEEANSQDSTLETNVKVPFNIARNVSKNDVDKSNDALKNLSKNITIKSTKQQKLPIKENAPSPENVPSPENAPSPEDVPDDYAQSNDSDEEVDNTLKRNIIKPQVFKNLLGHVNITPRNFDNTNVNKSMVALHATLSKNFTVKSNQQRIQVDKNVPSSADNMLDEYDSVHEVDGTNITLKHNIQKPTAGNKSSKSDKRSVEKTDVNKSMHTLKNLSKHITIKSSHQQKMSVNEDVPSPEDMLDGYHSNSNDSDTDTSNILQHNIQKQKNIQNMASRNLAKNYFDKSKEALKNLSKQITITCTNQQKLLANKNVASQEDMLDAISTFSDDEINVTKNIISKTIQKQSQHKNMIGTFAQTSKNFSKTEVHQSDTLKHLSKHVSIKSSNQQKLVINKNVPCPEEVLDFEANDFGNEVTRKPGPKSVMLQLKIKSLSKNVTVKSENSSPKMPIKPQSTQGIKNNVLLDGYDSDSNSCPGNVKITEMYDDNDNEASSQLNNTINCQSDSNIIVHSPSDDEMSEENSPKETSNLNNQSAYLDSLRNISKHITIKSRTENNVDDENLLDKDSTVPTDVPAVNKELSIKPYKQMKPGYRDDNETTTSRTINQSSTNQKNVASSNRMNTVNKEVTVKTFQTETYIEEVTTTVTKTIRTVNQTVKQEVRNTSQTSSMPMIRPQRMPGIRPNQQRNNLQGTLVRQQAPTIGPRIRNPMTPIRPAIGSKGVVRPSNQSVPVKPTNQLVPVRPSNQLVPVRPSNQLVPVRPSNQLVPVRPSNQLNPTRPGLNVTRPSNPRMPVMKKIQASTSNPQKPVVGKPLKMSPNAQVQSIKRPVEDSIGHFSCFKKPKESLIPVSDIPVFTSKQDSGTAQTVQYASSSNMSRSNFTSTTKIVKGNSVVTSTKVKSEANASSQQLSRLSNMSGLKIMKTSQTKQASQVEEKCEVSASKRTALEAIEKLQKSGLLVKKPRVEEDRFSDHSNSDVDDNFET